MQSRDAVGSQALSLVSVSTQMRAVVVKLVVAVAEVETALHDQKR